MTFSNNATDGYSASNYQVSTVAGQGNYSTIQFAIDSAVTNGAGSLNPIVVWIQSGYYTENLTLAPYVSLAGALDPSTGAGVSITGNAIYPDPSSGNLSITNIGFVTANSSAALSFQSTRTSTIDLDSVFCDGATGIGFECIGSGMTVNCKNISLKAASGGICKNISAGTIQFISSVSNFNSTASTISGGTLQLLACNETDAFAVTGSGELQAFDTVIQSSALACVDLGAAAVALMVNCSLATSNSNTITGTGTLEYANLVALQTGTPLDPGLTLVALNTFPSSSGVTLDGDTGSATGSTINLIGSNAGASVSFSASGSNIQLNLGDSSSNVILGSGTGGTGTFNAMVGSSSGGSLSGSFNATVGYSSLSASTNTSANISSLGYSVFSGLKSGVNDIGIGSSTGNAYTGSESNNILLNSPGVVGESNVLRLGSGTGTSNTQLSKAFISGINGNTVSSAMMVTINSSTNQMGVQSIPATGITTVGDVTSGSVAFNGTAGTTLTGTTAGLTLTAATNSGNGADVILEAGATSGTNNNGGRVYLTAGNASGTSTNGGFIQITGGSGGTSSSIGGAVNLLGGAGGSASGAGGAILIQGGPSTTSSSGGAVSILSGSGGSSSGSSGNVQISTGNNTGTSNASGNINVITGTASGTNQAGGVITLTAGQSTGTGAPGYVLIKCDPSRTSSSSSLNTPISRVLVNGFINPITSASSTAILQPVLNTGNLAGGMLNYTIEASNGTDYQCATGIVAYSMTNKAGTITGTAANLGSEVQNITGVNSITNTWAVDSSGNLNLTSTSTLVGVTIYRITYTAFSNSQHDIQYF